MLPLVAMRPPLPPQTRPRAARLPRRVREEQILVLAEELFAERGYGGVTMSELAERAGVTKPVIYSIVRSKDELYRRCFARAAEELAAAVGAATREHIDDLGELVAGGNLAFFRFIDTHAQAFSMLFSEDAGGRHAAHLDQVRASQAQLLSGVLTGHAMAFGRELDPVNTELAVQAVNGAAEALAQWWRHHPETSAERLAARMTELLLPGLQRLVQGQ